MIARCVRANTKQIGVVTRVDITMDVDYQIKNIRVIITRRCVSPTAVKVSNAEGQKGEMAFPNHQQVRVNGRVVKGRQVDGVPVGIVIPGSTGTKRSTPGWFIKMLLNRTALALLKRPRYGVGMALRNPYDAEFENVLRSFGIRHRQMGFDADGKPVGLTSVGPTSMYMLYISAVNKDQINPAISEGERGRDPLTGMPRPVSGSKTATLSQQGLSFLPDDPNIIHLISNPLASDRTRQVYCQRCETVGYVQINPKNTIVKCHYCPQNIVYDPDTRRVLEFNCDDDNFGAINIRGSAVSIIRLFRATGIDTSIVLRKKENELGEYIE